MRHSSTDRRTMPTSVMPKGVEHRHGMPSRWKIRMMPTSVMPKGVEHRTAKTASPAQQPMPTSVMPKGVEHGPLYATAVAAHSYAHLCDAERR